MITKKDITKNIVMYGILAIALSGFIPNSYSLPNNDEKYRNERVTERGKKELDRADKGVKEGMEQLASFYRYGKEGFQKDVKTAVEWYEKALKEGSSEAASSLGDIYKVGEGEVKMNILTSFNYYRKSALMGNSYGMYALGSSYYRIGGGRDDRIRGDQWLIKAVKSGDTEIQKMVGDVFYHGIKNRSPDKKKAFYCYYQVARTGDSWALCKIGEMYENGSGIEKNYQKAFKCYKLASDKGNSEAMYNIAVLHHRGYLNKVTLDYEEIKRWYGKAAELGHIPAILNLGELLKRRFTSESLKEAVGWYRKGAEEFDDPTCMNQLGKMYQFGAGVKQDYEKALHWYKKSANNGYHEAIKNVALMYEKGFGMEPDPKKAKWWNEKLNKVYEKRKKRSDY